MLAEYKNLIMIVFITFALLYSSYFFISTDNRSHLVVATPGPNLTEALRTSPVVQGEDGYTPAGDFGSGFDVDPNLDPELALVSDYYSVKRSESSPVLFLIRYAVKKNVIARFSVEYCLILCLSIL